MASRSTRAEVARQTLAILEDGGYSLPGGSEVSILDELDRARSGSVVLAPEEFGAILRRRDRVLDDRGERPNVELEVANETTLSAAGRLLREEGTDRVMALNFASAKNPGGGFLNGSQAQEESLARASGLYACISPLQSMYEANRLHRSCLYTDHMIYSPDVPVFRDDDDRLLVEPYPVSFLTAPAANAGAIRTNEPGDSTRIEPVMRSRIEKLLALAVVHGHETLVLGAWGCGVFRNDPELVAAWFGDHLTGEGSRHARRVPEGRLRRAQPDTRSVDDPVIRSTIRDVLRKEARAADPGPDGPGW